MRIPLPSRCLSRIALALLLAASAAVAFAQNTRVDTWIDLETGVAVKFSQVNANICTWSFKNTSNSQTLQYMKFSVTHPDWQPGQVFNPYNTKTDKDNTPNPLKPGEVWGGWATYTAPGSCTYVTINVLDRTWK
jgi:hypothetical protein